MGPATSVYTSHMANGKKKGLAAGPAWVEAKSLLQISPHLHICPLVFRTSVYQKTLTDNYNIKQMQFIKPTPEPRASDPEESNEVFDRVIRGWLLQYHCSKSSINYRHQIRREKLHPLLNFFYKYTLFSTSYMRDSFFEKRARQFCSVPNKALVGPRQLSWAHGSSACGFSARSAARRHQLAINSHKIQLRDNFWQYGTMAQYEQQYFFQVLLTCCCSFARQLQDHRATMFL